MTRKIGRKSSVWGSPTGGLAMMGVLLLIAVQCVAWSVGSFGTIVRADVPLAARLLAEPYASTGTRVNVSNFSNMRGLANDGTTVYLLGSNGNVMTVPLSSITISAGGSVTVTGTSHTVGWGQNGGPSVPDLGQLSLAYSHGCLFITNDSNTEGSIRLYCIDVSDYSVTELTVPPAKPLPEGYYYVRSSLIDFSDGRIGKVSKYVSDGSGGYVSTLRTYTVTGTGKNATIAWSQDYLMGDSTDWATDEHGIATDGTYLYRIQWRDYNPNTKVWTLTTSGTASIVYSGQYTMPFDNMHFLAHNHTDDYYIVGHWNNNNFFITTAADPGPGPGNPLTPTFATPTSIAGGYTVQISNYDAAFTWGGSATNGGSVSINGSGLVTVSGLSGGASSTVTVTTTRSGYPSGSGSTSGTAADATPPVISSISSGTPTSTAATITWTTDENASTKVSYGLTSARGTDSSETDTSPRVTSHSKTLSSLLACTTYHYVVTSTDGYSNTATSSDGTFTTAGCTADTVPSSIVSTSITTSSGGSTSTSSGGHTMTVTAPANFTDNAGSVVIQVKAMTGTDILQQLGRPSFSPREVGTVVFDAKAIINGTTVLDSFDSPVTISYQYSDVDIRLLDEGSLRLYHHHGGSWRPLNDCNVSVASNTITCTAPSFSIFALFGQLSASGGGGGSGGGSGGSAGGSVASVVQHAAAPDSTPSSAGCTDPVAINYGRGGVCRYRRAPDPQPTPPMVAKQQPSECVPYLTSYIRLGAANDAGDVRRLETFLNENEGEQLPVDGAYSREDAEAVKRFQEKYRREILEIWGLSAPTGYVYRTTVAKVNALHCQGTVACPAFTQFNSLTENTASEEIGRTKALLTGLGFPAGTGDVFDERLDAALKAFQEEFAAIILRPWGLSRGTGYKYKATNKFLNLLSGCETAAVDLDGKGILAY